MTGATKRKTLLIGSTGFLGQTFKREFPDRIIAVGRDHVDLTKDFEPELQALIAEHNPDSAIITAAFSKPDVCKTDPEGSRAVNVTGTIKLLENLRRSSVKPVFFSTDHVFNGQKGHYKEDDPYSAVTVYGKQKVETEQYIRDHFRHSLILRTSKQVAMRVDPMNNLSEMALKLKAGQPIKCAFDSWLSPSFVEDIARVTMALLDKPASGIYHISSSRDYTRLELGEMVAQEMGVPMELVQKCSIEDFKFAEIRPPKCILDGSKLERELGYAPTPLKDGIRRVLASI